MPKYAQYDPAVPSPSSVIGWFDTDDFTYADLPAAADLLQVTDAQWAAREANPNAWAVSNGALVAGTGQAGAAAVIPLKEQAQLALDASDRVVLRCYEHAVAVPTDWATYRATLRTIVSGAATATGLPTIPAYPTGT